MSDLTQPDLGNLPLPVVKQINDICNRFEKAWRQEQPPRIEDYLDGIESRYRETVLRQLLLVELEYRDERGDSPRPEDYLARFPLLRRSWVARALAEVNSSGNGTNTVVSGNDDTAADTFDLSPELFPPDYELLEEIARGGMGVVFRARQKSLNRIVALKMILTGRLASEKEVQRFRLEAEAAARLDHPHIVPIYEVGEHKGYRFFSMKFLEGGNLAVASQRTAVGADEHTFVGPVDSGNTVQSAHNKQHKARPRSARKKRAVDKSPDYQLIVGRMVKIARAVHHANQRGILHRDLKPANILLDAQGEPHVSDFGLATTIGDDHQLTESRTPIGTASYMAPEQAAGRNKALTVATDVYGLGAILYELLTGMPPFRGETMVNTLQMVLENEPATMSRVRPNMPRDVETICLKCLSKIPAKRYDSAEELAEDLERYLAGEPIRARRVGIVERAGKWIKRHPMPSALAVVILLAATALGWGGARYWYDLQKANADLQTAVELAEKQKNIAQHNERIAVKSQADAEKNAKIAKHQQERAESLLTINQRHTYIARLQLVQNIAASDPQEGLKLLRDETFCPPVLRDFAWGHLHRFCRQQEHHRELKLPFEFSLRTMRLTKDGQTLLAVSQNNIVLWDVNKEKISGFLFLPFSRSVMDIALSANDKYVAAGHHDGVIRVWDLPARKLVFSVKHGDKPVTAVAFSPDGLHFASGSDGEVKTWSVAKRTVQMHHEFTSDSIGCWSLAYHRGGKQFAVGCSDGCVRIFDIPEKKHIRTLARQDTPVRSLSYSPDGRRLYSAGGDEIISWNHVTRNRRALRDARGSAPLLLTADGKTLITAGGGGELTKIIFWDTNTRRVWHKLQGPPHSIVGLAVSEKSNTLASGSRDGTIMLWDLQALPQQVFARVAAKKLNFLSPTSDNKLLLSYSTGRQIQIHDVAGKRPVQRMPAKLTLESQKHPIYCGAVSPTGDIVATGSWDMATGRRVIGTIRLWDMESGKAVAALQSDIVNISFTALAFSPDGRTLAAGDGRGQIWLWDLATLTKLSVTIGHADIPITWLRFAADGKTLLSAVGLPERRPELSREAKAWTVSQQRLYPQRHFTSTNKNATPVAFHAGKSLLAWSNGTEVRLFNLAKKNAGTRLPVPPGRTICMTFSRDGNTLYIADYDGAVQLWDVATGQLTMRLQGFPMAINRLALSRDGKALFAAGFDGVVRAWRAD